MSQSRDIDLLSVDSDENSRSGATYALGLSQNGKVALFRSDSDYTGDGPGGTMMHGFARNRETGTTVRVDVRADGTPSAGPTWNMVASASGRFVAFNSPDDDIVADDANGTSDVFLRDLELGTTTLVSAGVGGGSADDSSFSASWVSDDGRYVMFSSLADDLVQGLTVTAANVFVRDMVADDVELVSVGRDGGPANGDSWGGDQSADGRYLIMISDATNLTRRERDNRSDIFLVDRSNQTTTKVTKSPQGRSKSASWSAEISDNGNTVAFSTEAPMTADDTNGRYDVFSYDVPTGAVELLSVTPTGESAAGNSWGQVSITADGRMVSYTAEYPRRQVDGVPSCKKSNVIVRDLVSGTAAVAGLDAQGKCPPKTAGSAHLSDDGYVIFDSAGALVAGDDDSHPDVFGVQMS